jgi:diguanylate cyclase (GGDEF)-like protein
MVMAQEILVIDDSPAIHALLAARLKSEPVNLHFAANGTDGLKMAETLAPDLILLDVDMPDPNGFEVCRRLKLNEVLANTPIVFLTGAGTTEEKIRGLELGALDYITKPFDPAELRARVRAALRLKFMMDLLARKAQIDALTGLWNRRYFDQRFEAELSLACRGKRPLAVLMIDLDRFKSINDNHGHPAGDEMLRRIAQVLAQSVRTEDVVCRYGGEEFAIIAPGISSGAADLSERLRAVVEGHEVMIAGKRVPMTVSIGWAASAASPGQSLLQFADAALGRAKKAGRNRVESGGVDVPAINTAA